MIALNTLIVLGVMAALAAILARYALERARGVPMLQPTYYATICNGGSEACTTSWKDALWSCRTGEDSLELQLQLQPVTEDYSDIPKDVIRAPGWPGFMPLPDIIWLNQNDKTVTCEGDNVFDDDDGDGGEARDKGKMLSWLRNLFEDLGIHGVRIEPQGKLTRRLPVTRDHKKRAHREAYKIDEVCKANCTAALMAPGVALMPDDLKKMPMMPVDLVDVTKGSGSGSGNGPLGADLLNDLDKRRFERYVTQFEKCSDRTVAFCVKEGLKQRLPARAELIERAYRKVYGC